MRGGIALIANRSSRSQGERDGLPRLGACPHNHGPAVHTAARLLARGQAILAWLRFISNRVRCSIVCLQIEPANAVATAFAGHLYLLHSFGRSSLQPYKMRIWLLLDLPQPLVYNTN
jgi:hypothetical protein